MTVLDDIKSRAYTAADTDKRWLIGEVDALTDKCTFQVGLTKLALADVDRLERIDRVTVEAMASSRAEFERLEAAMNRWLKEYDHPMPSYFRDALRSTGDGA